LALRQYVEVRGLDKVKRHIESRYGKAALQRRGKVALKEAADTVLIPAVERETPTGDATSPWRRPTSKAKKTPLKTTVYAKALRPRADEIAATRVAHNRYYRVMVIRGAKPHDIPNFLGRPGYTFRHPGAHSNDIIGSATKGDTRKRVVEVVKLILMRP
jgi:hypothetical protein